MNLRLQRSPSSDNETLGQLFAITENESTSYTCLTLELPDLFNQHSISCIPAGIYDVTKRRSLTHGMHFHILNVPNRDMILIHSGNFASQTKGCILVGQHAIDLNFDGAPDITHSKKTLSDLYKIMPDSFTLEILSDPAARNENPPLLPP